MYSTFPDLLNALGPLYDRLDAALGRSEKTLSTSEVVDLVEVFHRQLCFFAAANDLQIPDTFTFPER